MTLIADYIKHEDKYVKRYGPKTIFLMQCGSFFEVYSCKNNGIFLNNRIIEFSQVCEMRIANKKSTHNGMSVYMSGFPEIQLDKYIKKLNQAGYTVPVWVQERNNPKIRKEHGIFSPGTNFDLTHNKISNKIMTVWIEMYEKTMLNKKPRVCCGIACVDIISGDVMTFQNQEEYFHCPTTFDELERFYCSYKPNELVIIHNCTESQIKDIISFADIDSNLIHILSMNCEYTEWRDSIKNCQKETYHEVELSRFYDIPDYDLFYDTYKLRERRFSTQSLVFLLNFLDFHNNDLVKQLKMPSFINIDERLRLGNHSLRQLNIISTGRKGKLSSLESLVNKCKTSMGKRWLYHKLLNPVTDHEYLEKEYSMQEYILKNVEYSGIYSSMGSIMDFERFFRKIILDKVAPSDLSMLYDNLNMISKIHQMTEADKSLNSYLNSPNLSKSVDLLRNKMNDSVILSIASTISCCDFETNIFIRNLSGKKRLDDVEYEYIEKINRLEAIRKFLDDLIPENSKKTKEKVKVHQTEKSGQFLITTKTRWGKLNKHSMKKTIAYKCFTQSESFLFDQSAVTKTSATGNNVRLDSLQLNQLYGEISKRKSNFKEVLKTVYKEYIQSFLEFKNEFNVIINYLVRLDFLLTRVHVAKIYNYCKPHIDNSKTQSFFNAKDIRHPLIEHLQDKEIYVPNDVSIGLEHTGILLFGTNAVGKSSLIRAIGMTIVLAQAGFFVPCSSLHFKPYTSVFTRILGNDDIFKGLSSFAVEMSELGSILRSANNSSLVLGDELCSGTETSSALYIIRAGLSWLHARNSSFIFATHFHELIDKEDILKLNRLVMKHMVVEYDSVTDALIYNRKLRNGSGTRLYGLEVCKSLAIPKEFLDLANRLRCSDNPSSNVVLARKSATYNAKKTKGNCEICQKKSKDIHHMNPQKMANEGGFIGTFHKNHKANLMAVCKSCHDKFTKNETVHRRVKTTKGYKTIEINM